MRRHSYTVMWVPHEGAKFRKFHLSSFKLAIIASFAALSLLTAGVFAVRYALFHGELSELRQLRVVSAELQRQNLDYEVSTEHLSERVASLQNFVKKLSVIAGLDTHVFGELVAGVGGPDSGELTSGSAYVRVKESLELMAGELATLEEKSVVLERFYEQNSLMLASTPSIWPVRGYLVSSFGQRKDPFTGEPDFHPGVDIVTRVGSSIVSTADGIVLYASRRGSYGNTVVVDHKYGMMTLYGHLKGFNVRPGKRVKRGDVIGYVGNTGRSRGPHLHYEVWVADRTVQPLDYILEYAKAGNDKLRESRAAKGTT